MRTTRDQQSVEPAAEPAATAWGDAEGRRRDILSSAERLLEEQGYAALTMRAVATGAGVSPGTVYQYFEGKEDVFVALMTQRLGRLQLVLAEADRSQGIAALLRAVLPEVTELWRRIGRSTAQWEAKVLAGGRRSEPAAQSVAAFRQTLSALATALRETADAHDQSLTDDPAMPVWVWDCLIGLADDLAHSGSRQHRVRPQRLITFATTAIERGILAQPDDAV